MESKMHDVEKRVYAHWFSDGFAEISGGAVFLVLGVYFALSEYLMGDSFWGPALQVGFVLILLGLIFGSRVLIRVLKQRFAYPRSGYVEYRVDKDALGRRRWMVGGFAAAIAVVMVVLNPLVDVINWVVAVTGLLVGAVLIFGQARSSGLERFLYVGGVSILLGLGAAISGWPNGYALGCYYGGMGLLFIVSGIVVLAGFLKNNPVAVEAGDEQ